MLDEIHELSPDEVARRQESMKRLLEALNRSEEDRQNGRGYTIEETVAAMRQAIAEVVEAKRNK